MKKDEADRIIEQYVKPLYGFSLNKTRSIDEAEELASRIILQVYAVLIKKDSFINLNSYIFKIAHNVWTRYVDDKTKSTNNLPIDNINVFSDLNVDSDIIQNEIAGKLRLEIAFLSSEQREIVLLHYYKGLKVKEIAEKLHLSEGTVKWHLYESKKEMRKGMEVMRKVGSLGINPIKFSQMNHTGAPGKRGDTNDFFKKSITQNIAYAAYHEPLTINQIAEELGISPVFVEDEVSELEEYGFMDKHPGGRYQTNMLIFEESEEKWEAAHSINKEYAEMLVNEYVLQFFTMEDAFKSINIYYPNNDFNLLLWSIIPYAMKKLRFPELEKIKYEEITTIRKDGGIYSAYAYISNDIRKSDEFNYKCVGEMYRDNQELSILGWQINTAWSNREMDWRDNIDSDYTGLYHFIKGELVENNVNIDVYRRLIDKGYLIKTKKGYKINVVYCGNKKITDKLNKILPEPSEKFIKFEEDYGKKIYEIEKLNQPVHMQKIIRWGCQNRLTVLGTYVLKNLVDKGMLKEPEADDAKGMSTILFVNR